MARRIQAGELRHRIAIQQVTAPQTYDTYGQVATAASSDWDSMKHVRAKIEQLSGAEGLLARQTYPTATHRICIDYLSTMDTTGATQRRILFGTRKFNILSIVVPDEERFGMELTCGEEK